MNLDELMNLWKQQFKIKNVEKIKSEILIYKEFLQQENKKYNLTRLDKESIIYQQYFYESLINFDRNLFLNPNMNVLDIGSGSGIPGILLKIIFENINLFIVESNKKKCLFLEELTRKLNLKNVYIFNLRCEDFIKNKKSFFDFITCRAVAELNILLELAIPGLKIGGVGYFLKSNNYEIELKKSSNIKKELQINDPKIEIKKFNDKTFVSLKFVKSKDCPEIYPRSWKEILNNEKN